MILPEKSLLVVFFSCLLLFSFNTDVRAAADKRFGCGGSVEVEVWEEWDTYMRGFLKQRLLQERLIEQGDTYALYDFQMYVHDLVSMARRCNRANRMTEIATLIRTAYDALEPETFFSPGRRWICRGGRICNEDAKLRNTEVMLCSVQFLGLASSVANALASSGAPLGEQEKMFIKDTVQIATEHLLRWGGDEEIDKIQRITKAKPKDVKNDSSSLFFTDKPLWMITIYAELAGVLKARDRHGLKDVRFHDTTKALFREHLSALLQFFSARISFQRSTNDRLNGAELADLDRGYWRLFAANRYAGYEKDEKPVVCVPDEMGNSKRKMDVRVPPEAVPIREDTGWDISHARRLVPALDALERNREAMQNVFHLKEAQLPARALPSAFANTLVTVIWNGDKAKPLFSNYWSGANGWYRVAYRKNLGKCNEGFPPYFMTGAFPTGGYITWARYSPLIGELGKTIYDLMNNPSKESSAFIERYYPSLGKSKRGTQDAISRFTFMSSLVGAARK